MTRLTISMLWGALILGCGACASGGKTPQERGVACPLSATDSLFLRAGPVYRECSVDRPARLIERLEVDSRSPMPACSTATIEFVVGTDGRIELETARVMDTENDNIKAAIVKTLPDFRFHPARLGEEPVRQIVTIKQAPGPTRLPFTVGRVGGPPVAPPPPPRSTTATLGCR